MNLVLTQNYAVGLAGDVVDTGAILDAAVMRLFVNDVQPTVGSDVPDFDPTTYVGHADKLITWLSPSIDDQGIVEVIGTVPEFRPTNGVTPNTVFGAIMVSSGGDMLMGGRFDGAPLPMESAMDAIVMTIRYRPVDQSIAIIIS